MKTQERIWRLSYLMKTLIKTTTWAGKVSIKAPNTFDQWDQLFIKILCLFFSVTMELAQIQKLQQVDEVIGISFN